MCILSPCLRAPLTQPGVNVVAGEYLLAVNGRELRASDNVHAFFEGTAGKQVVLKVGKDPGGTGARHSPSTAPAPSRACSGAINDKDTKQLSPQPKMNPRITRIPADRFFSSPGLQAWVAMPNIHRRPVHPNSGSRGFSRPAFRPPQRARAEPVGQAP